MSGNRINKTFSCIANEFPEEKKSCNSSDALSIYQEEHDGVTTYNGFCFSCGQGFTTNQVHTSSLCSELGIEEGIVKNPKAFALAPKAEPLTGEQIGSLKKSIGFTDKPYRSLKPEWLKFFGHMVERNKWDEAISIYYPETEDDVVTGFKIRYLPKSFGKVGRTGKSSQLAGQFRYKAAGKRVLIVGGEGDMVAAWGAISDYYKSKGQGAYDSVAVVSPTCGEGSAAAQIARNYDFFDRYEEIYVGMDNDKAGIEATENIVKVLPADKIKLITWSAKDPHKLVEDGREAQLIRDFFNAKDFVDSGIKSAADATTEVVEFLTATKIGLPEYLHRLEFNMRGGIRSTGAIVNIIGDTSIGKSFFSDNLSKHWFFNSPLVPTIISLERVAGELLADLYSLHLQKNLTWFSDGHDAVRYLDRPEVKQLCDDLVYTPDGRSRFFIIDERDGSIESLKKQVDRAIKKHGSKLIIFDPLTDFLRSLGTEAQEEFMMYEKMMKKEGIVFINILHTRKPSTDKEGKVRPVTEYDALGSGTFVQSADINIVLNRNKMAEDPIERNTTEVSMPKCRGGITGVACKLYYDPETRQQYDADDFFSGRQTNPNYVPSVQDEIVDHDTGEIFITPTIYDNGDEVVEQDF